MFFLGAALEWPCTQRVQMHHVILNVLRVRAIALRINACVLPVRVLSMCMSEHSKQKIPHFQFLAL